MHDEDFKTIVDATNRTIRTWKRARGAAPEEVSDKLETAMLDWISSLTTTLDIWLSKGPDMTEGELILARANMGSLVESWLKFFFCVYLDDYRQDPIKKWGRELDPDNEQLGFEELKQHSRGILWNKGDETDRWVGKAQRYRNAIHSFHYRKIGTPEEFIADISSFRDFIEAICLRLPPLEDYLEV